ncbi:hypothetical protein [Anoxybacillus flavithermus]|uniref:Uncharacterized protein n=1 Tax=Anoxybacillus flavithermus TaxID=33934 RepID=A0A178TLR8_9BACL|nr:hypothetical protein [Anoxybacillus flavithermus]OAO82588.1 hypothetical protein TAF16_0208 [Anoxybacillus flavithermus]
MAYSVVRLDNLKAVYTGHIFSVKAPEELQNGFVGHLGGFVSGEREVRTLEKPTTTSIEQKGLVLIAHSPINYDETRMANASEQNYKIAQDEVVRAYELNEHDIFSVTKEGIDLIGSDPVVGNYVIAQNKSFKLKEVSTLNGKEAFVGKIVAKETVGTTTVVGANGTVGRVLEYVVIEVIKNVK